MNYSYRNYRGEARRGIIYQPGDRSFNMESLKPNVALNTDTTGRLANPTAEDVYEEAGPRVRNMLRNYQRLRDLSTEHQSLIRRCWDGKSASKRTKLLIQWWPDMAKTHRPDSDAMIRLGDNFPEGKSAYREAFVWPYINIEDLRRPGAIPYLI